MIKRTKIGNTEFVIQFSYHYWHTRVISISFDRMKSILSYLPRSVRYCFAINLWKYVFKFTVRKEKDDSII